MTDEAEDRSDEGRPAIEWVVGAASAILVACLVLYLGYQALFGDSRSADLIASIERVDHLEDATTVTVVVRNRGDEAASVVTVLAIGPDASGRASQKQIEFDYIAAHAVRRGAFIFPGAVAADEVRLEIGGYTEP